MREIISVHTERALEYDTLKALLKRYTVSPLGAAKTDRMAPQRDIGEIRRTLALCSEVKRATQDSGGFSLVGLRDLNTALQIAAKPGSILEANQLLDVWHVLRVAAKR